MTKLTLQIGDRITSAQESSEDLSYSDILEMLEGLMVGQTFSSKGFHNALLDYAET